MPTALPTAVQTIRRELNQSSSWPCSSIVWKHAEADGEEPDPCPVDPLAAQLLGLSRGRKAIVMRTARIPTGRLMKKIHRQPSVSVR